MINKMVEKDERTTFVENASYTFGYKFVTYVLFIDIIYRALRFNEAPWDLFAIIIISGIVITMYQYKKKILVKNWIKVVTFIFILTFIIAFLTVVILKKFWN